MTFKADTRSAPEEYVLMKLIYTLKSNALDSMLILIKESDNT